MSFLTISAVALGSTLVLCGACTGIIDTEELGAAGENGVAQLEQGLEATDSADELPSAEPPAVGGRASDVH